MKETLQFLEANWRSALEILILAVLLYQLFASFKATRAARIALGIFILVGSLFLLTTLLKLEVIGLVLRGVLYLVGTGLVVLFQPELRRLLEKVSSRFFTYSGKKSDFFAGFQEAVAAVANKRFGALFAFERGIDLAQVVETGVTLDAQFSKELALTVFHPRTALHDGGVIIKGERIVAAACVFPISQRQGIDRTIGLRHRAGLGITEETDAVVVVVSEETGQISLCHAGRIEQQLKPAEMAERLQQLLAGAEPPTPQDDKVAKVLPA